LRYAAEQGSEEYPANQGRKMSLHPDRVPGHVVG
jgi:hypothetical protein